MPWSGFSISRSLTKETFISRIGFGEDRGFGVKVRSLCFRPRPWRAFNLALVFLLFALPAWAVDWPRVLAKISPAVVTIVTKQIPAEDFFALSAPPGVGSGVVVDKEGLVLAPAPLVRQARWIDVLLANGEQCGASLVGIDYFSETALLRLKCRQRVAPASFSRSIPKPGQEVVLVGRPRSRLAASFARVSAAPVAVSHQGLLIPDLVAAPLNLSSVGQGPVFDAQGRLVGLAVDLPNLRYPGGLYFIPATRLYLAYQRLKDKQEAAWPWLGVEVLTLSPTVARVLHLPLSYGVIVTKVFPGSPAARAGLRPGRKAISIGNFLYRPGDVIVAVNGHPVKSAFEFFYQILIQRPGARVTLTFYRGRTRHHETISLSRRIFLHP